MTFKFILMVIIMLIIIFVQYFTTTSKGIYIIFSVGQELPISPLKCIEGLLFYFPDNSQDFRDLGVRNSKMNKIWTLTLNSILLDRKANKQIYKIQWNKSFISRIFITSKS